MQNKKIKLQRAFFKGAIIGPLAIVPASIILFIAVSWPVSSLSRLADGLISSLFIALWGVCLAYALTFTYGTALWLALLKIRKLNLIWLLVGSLVPSFLVAIYTQSFGFTVLFAYYSLAVSFSCWYFGLRNKLES